MTAKLALGLKVRTGKAAVIALGGPVAEPVVMGKGMIQVALSFEEGAVFHVAQELSLAKARVHVERSEARFTKLAQKELGAFVRALGADVVSAAQQAPSAKPLPPIDRIIASHPLVHAAEIELYRRVFAAACQALGLLLERVDEPSKELASALGWTPARVAKQLAAVGKASGRPWAAEQKAAALSAWHALARR